MFVVGLIIDLLALTLFSMVFVIVPFYLLLMFISYYIPFLKKQKAIENSDKPIEYYLEGMESATTMKQSSPNGTIRFGTNAMYFEYSKLVLPYDVTF